LPPERGSHCSTVFLIPLLLNTHPAAALIQGVALFFFYLFKSFKSSSCQSPPERGSHCTKVFHFFSFHSPCSGPHPRCRAGGFDLLKLLLLWQSPPKRGSHCTRVYLFFSFSFFLPRNSQRPSFRVLRWRFYLLKLLLWQPPPERGSHCSDQSAIRQDSHVPLLIGLAGLLAGLVLDCKS
jgi:hypothetical protein